MTLCRSTRSTANTCTLTPNMHRSNDLAPQPVSQRQLAKEQQYAQLVAHTRAQSEDPSLRDLRLKNAKELAALQAEIQSLVTEKQRLEALVLARPSDTTDQQHNSESHLIHKLELVLSAVQRQHARSSELDSAIAEVQGRLNATDRDRRIDSYRADANRDPALVREQRIRDTTTQLNRILEEQRRWQATATEADRAQAVRSREYDEAVTRVRAKNLEVEVLSDRCALLAEALSIAQAECDRSYMTQVLSRDVPPAVETLPPKPRSLALPAPLAPYLSAPTSKSSLSRAKSAATIARAPVSASELASQQAERDAQRQLRHLTAMCGVDDITEIAAAFAPTATLKQAIESMEQRLGVLEAHLGRGGRVDPQLVPDLVRMHLDALGVDQQQAPQHGTTTNRNQASLVRSASAKARPVEKRSGLGHSTSARVLTHGLQTTSNKPSSTLRPKSGRF